MTETQMEATEAPPLTAEAIQAMSTDQRVEKIMELQHKMQETGHLEDDEVRLAIALIQAERVVRAGSQGGSRTKKEQAQKAFDLSDF